MNGAFDATVNTPAHAPLEQEAGLLTQTTPTWDLLMDNQRSEMSDSILLGVYCALSIYVRLARHHLGACSIVDHLIVTTWSVYSPILVILQLHDQSIHTLELTHKEPRALNVQVKDSKRITTIMATFV